MSHSEQMKALNDLLHLQVQLQNFSDSRLAYTQNIYDQIDIKSRQLDTQSRLATNAMSNYFHNHSSNNSNNSNSHERYSNTNGNVNVSSQNSSKTTNSSASTVLNQNANISRSESTVSERLNSSSKEYKETKETSLKESNSTNSNSNNGSVQIGSGVGSGNGGNGGGKRTSRRSNGMNNKKDQDSNGGSGDEQIATTGTVDRNITGTTNNKRVTKRQLKTVDKSSTNKNDNNKRRKNSLNYNESQSDEVYNQVDPDEPTYCLCEQVSYGEMICCDNPNCKIEWFHFVCVSLTAIPKGRWFCPKCRGERSNIQRK